MKFEKLTIRNIASMAEAEIDFTSSPLAEARLFLINGPTGSGKSTLLDGVCLALFCTAPRLEGYGLRKGVTDVLPDSELQLSSPLGLVRRGSSEAEATLVFEGNNGRRYRATWRVVPFVKGKKKGQIQGDIHTLTDFNSNESWDKVKEIRAIISSPEVVGLDFKRFCRTTMLAQGSFASFLSADEADKSRILEKIVGIEQFSEIGKKIFERRAELRRQLDNAQEGIKGITVLSEEERREKEQLVSELGKQEKALREKLAAENEALQWLEQEEILLKRLHDAQTEAKRLEEDSRSAENTEKRELCKQWAATAPLRELHKTRRLIRERGAEIAAQKSGLLVRKQRMALIVAHLRKEEQTLQTEIAHNQQRIALLAPLMPLVEQAAVVCERRRTHAANIQRISSALTEIENRRATLRKKEAEQKRAEVELQNAIRTLGDRQKSAAEALEKVNGIDFDKLRQALSEADSRIAALSACLLPLERYAGLLDNLQKLSETADDLNKKIATGQKSSADAEAAWQEAMKAECLMAETVETARRGCEESAVALRHKLQKGDICPVCGREIEEIVSDETFAALVRPLEDKLAQLRTKSKETGEASARLTAEVKVYQSQLAKTQSEAEQLRVANGNTRQQLDRLLSKCGLVYSATAKQAVEELIAEVTTQREQTNKELTEGNRRQSELIEQNRLLGEANERKTQADKLISTIRTEQARIGAETEGLEKDLETTNKANLEIEKSISALLPEEYKTYGVEEACALATETEAIYNKLLKTSEDKKQQREQTLNLIAYVTETLPETEQTGDGADSGENDRIADNGAPQGDKTTGIEAESIRGTAKKLADDLSATAEAERINHAERMKNEAEISQFHYEHPELTAELCSTLLSSHSEDEMTESDNALKKLADATAAAAAIAESAKAAFEEHHKKRGAAVETPDKETLKASIASDSEQSGKLNREIGSQTSQLETDSANRKRHAAQLDKIAALEKEHLLWSDLDREFGGNNGSRFSKIACAFILEQLLARSNFYLEMFSKRYHLEAQPDSTEILVYDNSSGHMRAFNTLSGGESFMVSLALALGLSAFQDSNTSPDTLFIDEGFGTLSAECLDTVTETLERLQNIEGRRVGIISHVEALRERIGTRITLEPRGTMSAVTVET